MKIADLDKKLFILIAYTPSDKGTTNQIGRLSW